MNPFKEETRKEAARELMKAGLTWESLNNDMHWKVEGIDFWPTTGKWQAPDPEKYGYDVRGLINFIKSQNKKTIKRLSVEDIFNVAKRGTGTLYSRCQAIHKEIYGN